ncbi:MAG: M48 family metallopeptidase [Planctomycetaceae bacterium]
MPLPISLLIALILAFGFDGPAQAGAMPRPGALTRTAEALGGVAVVALAAFGLGRWVAFQVGRWGYATSGILRRYRRGLVAVEVLSLAAFGATVHGLGWPAVVRSGFGLGDAVLIDDALILLPFLLAELAAWWVLHAAERALRPSRTDGPARYLMLKARQSLGLVLPGLLLIGLGQDLARRQWPRWSESPWATLIGMAVLGAAALLLAPVSFRLAWPAHRLPPGPLRDRLEHQAHRLGFRFTDILVWDTGRDLFNAGVTGTLPWFRYVLLTDGLIERLEPREIEAVFGHEIGHIAHRHLLDLGLFFLGSLFLIALLVGAIDEALGAVLPSLAPATRGPSMVASVAEEATALLGAGLYFLVVFGLISRRFERQADVFGCRAVSCGQPDCPPHIDVNLASDSAPLAASVCPAGVRICANAMDEVAALNGLDRGTWTWRHGSIARRIAFLESLEGKPEAVRRFQRGVVRLRLVIGLVLLATMATAIGTGAIDHLR